MPLIDIPETTVAPADGPVDTRTELARCHADCVGWALACCGFDRAEAEDVLQASYLKVLDGRAVFSGRSTFRTWLFGVIRRTAAEHRRRGFVRRLVRLTPAHDERAVTAEPAALDALVAREGLDELRRALQRLPLRQRQVLHLVFQQSLTIQGAAAVLGVSLGSARTHYERGKARLRALLAGERE